MSESFRTLLSRLSERLFSRQAAIFLIFLAISTVLWFVTSLNEEVQRQVTCRLQITGVPDSVVFINIPPEEVTATVRGRGTHVFRGFLSTDRTISIDFRKYVKGNRLVIGKTAFLGIVQQSLGDDRLVQEIYPDTLGLYFTGAPPVYMPVKLEVTAAATPNMHISSVSVVGSDTVKVYSADSELGGIKNIFTVQRAYNGISSSRVVRVPLVAPRGCRVVPDSIDVRIDVEPFVTVTRQLPVQAVNVPNDISLVLRPSKVTVSYRVPASMRNNLPQVSVLADYGSVAEHKAVNRMALSLDPWRSFVFLDRDSVEFTVGRREKP